MSKERTEASKYKSPSTNEYCTAAQFLAEIICQRSADKDKVGTLPYKFWNLPKWNKLYVRQVGLANKFIKKHGDDFITFIQSKSGKYILSLGMKNIEEKYKYYKSNKPKENLETIKVEPVKNEPLRRKSFGGSLLDKLNRIKE